MRISEIITPRQMNKMGQPLLRTMPVHYDQARGNKTQVIVLMPPMDFLRLAAPPDAIKDFMAQTQGLQAYNRYAKSGENILMPFLRIAVLSNTHGKVISHEGRHRAASLIKAHGDWMRVALMLDPRKDYEPELAKQDVAQYGRHRSNMEYYMTAADLPSQIYNQYNEYISVDSARWKIEEPDFLGKYRR